MKKKNTNNAEVRAVTHCKDLLDDMPDAVEAPVSSIINVNVVNVDANKTKAPVETDPAKWEYTQDEMKVFNIDRKQEDGWVNEYQLTGDSKLLERLYLIREPTLRVWSRKCSYIGDSEEDVFADLRMVWQRCVSKYKYAPAVRKVRTKSGGFVRNSSGEIETIFKRTNFNTFLFTSIKNHISNVNKKRYSKKRLDDDGKPIDRNMRSLDLPLSDDDGMTLYDTLMDDTISVSSNVETKAMIRLIADGDKEIEEVLSAFIASPQMKRLSTACNIKYGSLPISLSERKALMKASDQVGGKRVLRKIEACCSYKKPKLLWYTVYNTRIEFEVLVKDIRLIRKLRMHIDAAKNRL